MALVSDAPAALHRRGKFVCPVDGCGSSFDKDRHYRMHYLRAHDEDFRNKVRLGGGAAGTRSTGRGGNMLNLVIAAMKKVAGPMTTAEIIDGVKSLGYKGSDNDGSVRSYIAQVIRTNPDAGINRVSHGVYELQSANTTPAVNTTPDVNRGRRVSTTAVNPAKKTRGRRVSTNTSDDATVATSVSPEVELEVLRRQVMRSEAIAMKLFEALMVAMQ